MAPREAAGSGPVLPAALAPDHQSERVDGYTMMRSLRILRMNYLMPKLFTQTP